MTAVPTSGWGWGGAVGIPELLNGTKGRHPSSDEVHMGASQYGGQHRRSPFETNRKPI